MNDIQDISNQLNTKLNEIRLSKNHPSVKDKVFVLLEGKTDIKLFRNIFNPDKTYITQINGKEKLKQALEILQDEGCSKIFGIKDSDFDNLENITYENINLFITDYADMEIHMIESSAFESIINEFASENCYESFLGNLKENLYNETISIGYTRWFNERLSKNINFKRLNYENFINKSECNISIDSNKLINEIINISGLNKNEIVREIENLKSISDDYLQICNGHDITKLLAYLFNHQGNSDKTNIKQERIEEALRLSYNFNDFQKTRLYNNLNNWQQQYNIQILKT
jgi:hypothetical protein